MNDQKEIENLLQQHAQELNSAVANTASQSQQSQMQPVMNTYNNFYDKSMKFTGFHKLNKNIVWAAATVFLGIVAFATPGLYLELTENEDSIDSPTVVASQTATVDLVEGELLVNDSLVQEGTEIEVNSTIETQENTFASLRLEDGSYFRLNENTQVTVSELTEGNYTFELETGEVYARVTESEAREYSIIAEDNTFTALGTAYSVKQEENTKLVVFESTVSATGEVNVTVSQGEELVIGNEKEDINVANLDQEFVEWNKMLEEEEFSDNLGVLETLVFGAEETEEEVVEEEEEPAEQQQTNNNNGGGQAQAPAPAPQPAPAPAPAPAPIAYSTFSSPNHSWSFQHPSSWGTGFINSSFDYQVNFTNTSAASGRFDFCGYCGALGGGTLVESYPLSSNGRTFDVTITDLSAVTTPGQYQIIAFYRKPGTMSNNDQVTYYYAYQSSENAQAKEIMARIVSTTSFTLPSEL